MASVVSSIPSGGKQLFAKTLGVNSGLKCKCDLIVKNSLVVWLWHKEWGRGLKKKRLANGVTDN